MSDDTLTYSSSLKQLLHDSVGLLLGFVSKPNSINCPLTKARVCTTIFQNYEISQRNLKLGHNSASISTSIY